MVAGGMAAVCALAAGAGAAAQDEWNTAKSTHFVVYYNNAPEDFIRRLQEDAEEKYNSIADSLGFLRYNFWLWDERAQIYVYDSPEEYHAATGRPPWVGGDVLPRKKLIRTFVHARDFIESVLPHELAHVIFREFVGFDNPAVPRWLDEGVATYQEKEHYAATRPLLKRALHDGEFVPLVELETAASDVMFSEDSAGLYYIEAFGIVDFLIGEYGKDAFVIFCQNLRDKKNLRRAIASAYPFQGLVELDAAWQKELKNK